MAGVTCRACAAAATSWTCGWYQSGCPDCEVRAIAQAPAEVKQKAYERMEARCGADAARALKERVGAEYQRIKALKEGIRT